jgi:Transposase DDE domain
VPSTFLPRKRLERNLTDLPAQLAASLGVDLSALAVETGAVKRWRQLRSGVQLLSACLGYTLLGLSLETLARTRFAGHLGPSALRVRLAAASGLLEALLGRLLARCGRRARAAGPGLRLYDTSEVTVPGGERYRVHLTLDPDDEASVGLVVTERAAGEWMRYATFGRGDVVLGDRGLGRASELHAIAARGAYSLLRVHLPNVPLEADASLRPYALVRRACRGDVETAVRVADPDGQRAPLPARLLVLPLPAEKVARARQAVRKKAKKEGRTPDRRTLLLAGYVTLVSTVATAVANAHTLGSWYRVRWQVELGFKRAKSLLHLVPRTKVGALLARTLLLTSLLVGVWLQAQLPPEAVGRSAWAAMSLLVCALVAAVAAPLLAGDLGGWLRTLGPSARAKRPRARLAVLAALERLRSAGKKAYAVA